MSPDGYLNYAGIFVSYFVKVAVAYLLCFLLARLLTSPRQRFMIWLGFMLGSLAYWIYGLTSVFPAVVVSTPEPSVRHAVPRIAHQFFVPAKFEHLTVVLGRVLVGAYILGVLLVISVGIWKRVRLHLLLRRGMSPSPELQQMFAEMCRHFGVKHCELLVLPKISSPATVCWWRPRIVLPQVCGELGDSALMADILNHELAHVARRDYFWSSVNDLVCGFLFFHPGAWQARKQMGFHREMACDLAVVAARPEHRADYAHTLTQVARLCLPRKYPSVGIDLAAVPSLLSHRVHAILNDPESISWAKKICRGVAGLALVSLYGVLCTAVAVAVAFVPAHQPVVRVEVQAAAPLQIHSGLHHKARREPAASPEAEDLITESPAYKLTSSVDSNGRAAELPTAEGSTDEASAFVAPGWSPAQRGSRPAGRTVESIIVATVGTVIGADKDDRSKRKDTSGTSNHFQSPNPY